MTSAPGSTHQIGAVWSSFSTTAAISTVTTLTGSFTYEETGTSISCDPGDGIIPINIPLEIEDLPPPPPQPMLELKDVHELSPLTTNVCSLESGYDGYGFDGIGYVSLLTLSILHENDAIVEIEFPVPDRLPESAEALISIANMWFTYGISYVRATLHMPKYHEELPLEEGIVESDDEEVPPLIGKKKRNHVEKLLEHMIFVSEESYLEDVQCRVHRPNKKLYVLKCFGSACSCKVNATKLKAFDLFKGLEDSRGRTFDGKKVPLENLTLCWLGMEKR
ncbi:hypothetical protein E5676_scaffold250G00270 [Cucumis melo var. makuwa]|uniref:Uncharacterized protein n=1 Tax=Cucumis melo var. makuwa TaxID=1194695 RepID=A0A5D3DK46_CUCMM|nr:hypothetical protein E5676_scaffold250G00270 [Cucumis melo var. makuwa]